MMKRYRKWLIKMSEWWFLIGEDVMKCGMDCVGNSGVTEEVLFMTWEVIKDVHLITIYNNLRNYTFV